MKNSSGIDEKCKVFTHLASGEVEQDTYENIYSDRIEGIQLKMLLRQDGHALTVLDEVALGKND